MLDSFIKCFVESHRRHRCGDRAYFLNLIIKPCGAIQSFIIYKDQSNLITLGISKYTTLNILTQVSHSFLHSSSKNMIERLVKTTSESVESLAINADCDRSSAHQSSLRNRFIKLFHAHTKFISHSLFASVGASSAAILACCYRPRSSPTRTTLMRLAGRHRRVCTKWQQQLSGLMQSAHRPVTLQGVLAAGKRCTTPGAV